MTSKIKQTSMLLAVMISFLFLAVFPQEVSEAVSQAINYCLGILLPAMFPYFVLSEYVLRSGTAEFLAKKLGIFLRKLFKVSPMGATPFLLGILSGYPVGAKCVAGLHHNGSISKREAHKLLTFCCGAGPAFVIGVLGGTLYKSSTLGITMYAIQILSAVLTGLLPIYRSKSVQRTTTVLGKNSANPLIDSVSSCIKTSAMVCCWVMLFSVLLKIQSMLLANSRISAVLALITELSSGSASLAGSSLPWLLKFPLASAGVSLGGLCVLLQTASVLSDANLSVVPYIIGKLLQSIFSFILSVPLSFLFQSLVSAGDFEIILKPASPFPWFFLPAAMIFLLFLQIPSSIWRKSAL